MLVLYCTVLYTENCTVLLYFIDIFKATIHRNTEYCDLR